MLTTANTPPVAGPDTRRADRTGSSASRAVAGTPLDGLQGTITPPAVSPLYRLGLAGVLVLLVLLPLVYLALVGGVAYLTWLHASNWESFIGGPSRRASRGGAMLYFTPLVAGVLMLLFMIKPMLARRGKGQAPIVVRPEQEPLLFAFIARICRVVKAPVPSEVVLDCQVNASASFRRGVWSFGGHDLTLTIGMPLVAGLTLQELAGVLAHELGHFAQGAGMRATYLIRSINGWFARVVYERDAWDARLEQWKRFDLRLTVVIWIAQAGIWINRRILQGLMMIGHACSCFMLRQMEYDADRYEIELSGTEAFINTSHKMPLLTVAMMQALDDAKNGWRAKRLPDDLPALVQHRNTMLTERDRRRLLDDLLKEETGSLDTHPSMRDRIAAAKRLARRGLFHSDTPAGVLFKDFASASRTVTLQHYDEVGVTVGQDVSSIMVSTVHMASDGTAARAASEAFETFFCSVTSPYRPLTLPKYEQVVAQAAVSTPEEIRQRVQEACAAAQALTDRARTANEAFHEALKEQHLVQRAGVLIDAGVTLDAGDWHLPEATTRGVGRALKTVTARIERQKPVLDASDRAMQQALGAALEMVARQPPPLPASAPTVLGGFRGELPRLLPAFGSVSRALDDLFDIGVYGALLQHSVESMREGEEIGEKGQVFFTNLIDVLQPLLQRVDAACAEVRYPFDTATGEVSLRQYLFGHDVPAEAILDALVRATRLMDVLPDLYVRLLGRFAQMAQAVEADAVSTSASADSRSSF